MNHDTYEADYIRDILEGVKTVAVVGASANQARPSFFVTKYLVDKGYTVYPLNPGLTGKEICGRTVFGSLSEVPEAIDMVDIFRNSEAAAGLVDEALELELKPKVIWMQLTVRHDEAAKKAEAAGIRVVMNRCPKIEYGKLSGEWGWIGGNSGMISSKKQSLHGSGKMQSLGIIKP